MFDHLVLKVNKGKLVETLQKRSQNVKANKNFQFNTCLEIQMKRNTKKLQIEIILIEKLLNYYYIEYVTL